MRKTASSTATGFRRQNKPSIHPYTGSVFTGVEGPCLIEKGRLTLPGLLRGSGYHTALFGKWHVGLTFFDHEGSGGNSLETYPALRAYDIPDQAPDTPGQLYNLDDDPGETTNLVAEMPERAAALKALLDESRRSGRSVPRQGR